MRRKVLIFIALLLQINVVNAKTLDDVIIDIINDDKNIEINEGNLRSLINEFNPTVESINSLVQESVVNQKTFNKNYDFNVFGSGQFTKSNNDWVAYDFSGTNRELNFTAGLEKQSVYGMSGKVSIGDNDGNYHLYGQADYDLNRSGLTLSYTMDLWKNFLGYQTLTNKLNLELNKKQAEVNAYIQKNNFYYSMRRLYWQVVIKNKKLEFYKEMVLQAEKNLEIVQKKHKSYIADKGDLAKAKANLDIKKVAYDNIKIDIEQTLQQFKYYMPDLIDKNITINPFDLTDTFNTIMICNKDIYKNKTTEWKNLSTYNEYISFMDDIIENEIKMVSREDDIDLNLAIDVNFRGVDSDLSSSYKDLRGLDRNDYAINLNLSKSFGDNNIEEDKIKLLKMNYNVTKNNTLASMGSFYTSYENIMKNMFIRLNNLHRYRINMEATVKNVTTKYNQGRASLTDLLDEQNNLIDANIQLIDMEGIIIDTILQYLNIFDKTLCDFNLKF